jgi:hypothetical protein
VFCNPFKVLEEGFLVPWSGGSINVFYVALFVRENEAKGGGYGPFGGKKVVK